MPNAVPMASFNGILAYNNAVFASATEVCEVESVSYALNREKLDASPRCSPGKKVFVAGDMDGEITLEIAILKSASNTSDSDDFLGFLLNNTSLSHVWVVDEYFDGIYFAEGMITNFSINQQKGSVMRCSMTIAPSTEIYQVLNKVISSTP